MTFRVSFRSNPRLYILVILPVLVAATVVVVFPVFGVIAGIVALLVGGYIDYQLVKFLRLQLASMVELTDEGTHCITSSGETLDFSWKSVSHAGICTAKNGRQTVFLYNEQDDKLITVPDSFSGLTDLATEISKHVEVPEYALRPSESVRDRLRSLITPPDDDEDE